MSLPFNWKEQRVLVTGGAGFLGSYVVEKLKARGAGELAVPRSREVDLRDAAATAALMEKSRPTIVIHMAAVCGGIGANQKAPGQFFYDNALMGIQLMEYSRRHKVDKFVQIGTVCAYPKEPPHIPFLEDDLWAGYPEETNAPYGLAKKMLLVQAQAYREQYGLNAIYLLPANIYGPRDNFDLESSHVIPAMVRKFVEAAAQRHPTVPLWGSGKVSREFLYVEDAAEGILKATELYNKKDPCNLGTEQEVTIGALAEKIKSLTGFTGNIRWDSTRPDGQPRRQLDVSRAKKEFGFRSTTSLEEGLKKTVEWYQKTAVLTHRH